MASILDTSYTNLHVQVFGIAANPAVVAKTPLANARHKHTTKEEMQAEVTSKPPEQQR